MNDERRGAIAEEKRRLRQLRLVVDLTCSLLAQGGMSHEEAERLVAATRRRVLELFPDKQGTFDLVLAPRFARLMDEFAIRRRPPGKVLPFRKRPPADG